MEDPPDWDAQRLLNMQRNSMYWGSLTSDSLAEISAHTQSEGEETGPGDGPDSAEALEEFYGAGDDALGSCQELFPFRDVEAGRIMSYIQQVSQLNLVSAA
jgi:hypothetical protein